MKKVLTMLTLVSLMFSVFLTGCGNAKNEGSTSNAENAKTGEKTVTKVKIMGFNAENARKTYLDLLRTKFPEYEIEYQFVENGQYENILGTYFATGEGPDIIEGTDSKFAYSGFLEDLSGQPFVQKYYDTGLKPFTFDGKVYGIPLQSWFEGIWYNKEIFEKNNLSVPKTFDEWMDIHDKLRAAGIKPQTMGGKSWEPMMKQATAVVLNEFYSKEENKNFDEEFGKGTKKLSGNWTEGYKIWSETVKRGNVTKEMLGYENDQAENEFATGKAAMYESGPWSYESIMKKNPNIKLGMFPIPGKEAGPGWLIGGPGSSFSINSSSKNKEAALKILEFTSTPEAQEALIKDNFGTSFLKGMQTNNLPEQYADSAEAFKLGHVYAPWPNWGVLAGNSVIIELGKQLQNYIVGSNDIDQVLAEADKKADEFRKVAQK
ncbi:ABC transporter substrate-binding protein [Paenibacillus sp. GCM10027629]|uniref:ABC transporter substrate-binding protein n=1 Tax=Paenibacillus sp. GCM10027629 TaxID=3273414 RepID=UPI0036265858